LPAPTLVSVEDLLDMHDRVVSSPDGADGPILHVAVMYGFPATGDVWEVADIESDVGTAVIRVVYGD
jgi:hypothetical protein